MKPTTDQLEVLNATHPTGVFLVEVGDHVAVIKRPSRPEYQRFQKRVTADKADPSAALEDLAKSAIVFPDPPAVSQILNEELPAFLEVIGNEVAKLARGQASADAKKYQSSPLKP
jgi:predicted outer membrane protein